VTGEPDARGSNWRFVVPGEASLLLYLPQRAETLPHALVPERTTAALDRFLAAGPYPAVAAPDLSAWARTAGGSRALLARLAAAVDVGGWLYAGFGNPWYPGRVQAPGALRLGTALRTVARAGLSQTRAYVLFPDQRCPAYLVDSDRREALDYFLRSLAIPFVESGSFIRGRIQQVALSAMRSGAQAAPHRVRTCFVPSFGVVAQRPA